MENTKEVVPTGVVSVPFEELQMLMSANYFMSETLAMVRKAGCTLEIRARIDQVLPPQELPPIKRSPKLKAVN